MLQFPENFLIGSATSAHQIEGDNIHNQWWEAEQKGKAPYKSGKACNHWELYEEDIALMKELGYDAYRFSVEWSRIVPKEGKTNEKALSRYQKIIDLLNENEIVPIMTLHHFTNPTWFMEKGGFTKQGTLQYWKRFVETIVSNLSGVHLVATFNEPIVYGLQSYLRGVWPPFKKSLGAIGRVEANMLRAHNIAYEILKEQLVDVKVGIVKNYAHLTSISEGYLDRKAVERANDLFNWNFMDALWGGTYKAPLPVQKYNVPTSDVDFIGLNYYAFEKIGHSWNPFRLCLKQQEPNIDRKKTLMGWTPYPRGIYEGITKFQDRYNKPIYITENGIPTKEDERRIQFILEHLQYVYKAIEKGYDVRGYMYWSFMDNFEWAEGFTPRFGLLEVDYSTFKRNPRKSAYVFGKIAKTKKISEGLRDGIKITEAFT